MVALPSLSSFRKLVHIGGVLFVPVALYNQYLALALSLMGLILFIFLERQKRRVMPGFVRHLYRHHELNGLAMEPLVYLLSIIALLALSVAFMPAACYMGIVAMTVGDGVAALAGRSLKGPRLPYTHKTFFGSLAGFILAAAVGYLFVTIPVAVAGAAGGMIAEAYGGKYDNAITAAAAFACAVFATLFF